MTRIPIIPRITRHLLGALLAALASAGAHATPCGSGTFPFPYTDVAAVGDAFCPGIMQAYVLGVTKGTTATTFSPNQTVDRTQMVTFLQRSLDQSLKRSSRHAALNQWWLPGGTSGMQAIGVGGVPQHCTADGDAIWSANGGQVVKVEASTGKVLGTWTGASNSHGALSAGGRIFVTGNESPGKLYVIDTTQAPGAVALASGLLGNNATGIAFDGVRLWTANGSGSVSIISVQATTPYPGDDRERGLRVSVRHPLRRCEHLGHRFLGRHVVAPQPQRRRRADRHGRRSAGRAGVRRREHLGAELGRQLDHRRAGQYRARSSRRSPRTRRIS